VTDLTRRDALQVLAGMTAALGLTPPMIERAWRHVHATAGRPAPGARQVFFTDHEWQTVRLLVDYIIPRDERSGSATDAGVPEFMDFILNENTGMQGRVRGGLAWLDTECRERFGGKHFVDVTDAQRRGVLDDIAWPKKARPELSQGAAFFSTFRDFTASGFYSSKLGVADLQYLGNTVVPEWTGCPPEALAKLGVRY
jgi:gluconate 2-dehydrogenase subunit 3-like protein